MGVFGKFEIEVDIIRCSGDVFHELFGTNPQLVSTMIPDKVHSCDLHEGDFGKPDSILQWEYTHDGTKSICKVIVETIDEEKKQVRFKMIEGSDTLEDFKSMTVILQVVPKGEFDAVKWVFEFERFDDYGPYPIGLMDFAIGVTRDLEAHHVKS